MASTGIRRQRSTDSRVSDSILDADRIQIESEKIFKETSEDGLNSTGLANITTGAGNYLLKDGDTREGAMGNQFKILEIINDTIQVDVTSGNFTPVLILNGEGGADDTLSTIIPGETVPSNRELIVQAAAQIITIKEITSILTPNSVDVILEVGDYAKLIYSQLLSAWVVVWVSSGGGGGISFPIDFPEDDRGTVGASTQAILFSAETRHSVYMIISGDIQLAFSVPPSNKTAISSIFILQDGTGGHTVTLPVGTINKEIVEAGILLDPDNETGILIEYAFGVFYAFLKTGNIVNGGSNDSTLWANFPAVSDVDHATFDSKNIDRLLFDTGVGGSLGASDAGITMENGLMEFNIPVGGVYTFHIGGNPEHSFEIGATTVASVTFLPAGTTDDLGTIAAPWDNIYGNNLFISNIFDVEEIDFFQAGQFIRNKADPDGGLLYDVNNLQSHIFKAGTVEIARFEESATNVYRLNMLDHSIQDAKDISWDVAASFSGSGGVPVIGYDGGSNEFRYNAPISGSHLFTSNNVKLMEISPTLITYADGLQTVFNPDTANAGVNIGLVSTDPSITADGDLWYNLTTNKFRTKENGVNVDVVGGGTSGANLQLDNLVDVVRMNRDILPNTTSGGNFGSSTLGDEWSNIYVRRLRFPQSTSTVGTEYMILRTNSPDSMIFNIPTSALFSWTINNSPQLDLNIDRLKLLGVDLDLDGHDILDVGDIGDGVDIVDNIYAGKIRFPFDTSVTTNTHMLGRVDVAGTSTSIINIPTNDDFIIIENGNVGSPLFYLSTTSNLLTIGKDATILGMNLNNKQITFALGLDMEFISADGFRFIGGASSFDNNSIIDVFKIDFTTILGAAVASINTIDDIQDILEIRLESNTDFFITDNGAPIASFENTLSKWKFDGASIFVLSQETQISDRPSSPPTPPNGFTSFYIINIAGAQSFRVKFDNGTEKIIADDT